MTVSFDYAAIERKLRHYFADSSPIRAAVSLGMGSVEVSRGDGRSVHVALDESLDARGNVSAVIRECEERLYPRMDAGDGGQRMSGSEIIALFMRGLSRDGIRDEMARRRRGAFIITRMRAEKDSVDYVDADTGMAYRAHCRVPVAIIRARIEDGIDGRALRELVTGGAEVERLGFRGV